MISNKLNKFHLGIAVFVVPFNEMIVFYHGYLELIEKSNLTLKFNLKNEILFK